MSNENDGEPLTSEIEIPAEEYDPDLTAKPKPEPAPRRSNVGTTTEALERKRAEIRALGLTPTDEFNSPLLSRELIEVARRTIGCGASLRDTAKILGVSYSNLTAWIKAGKHFEPGDLRRDLRDTINRTRAETNRDAMRNIIAAGREDWRASAHYLAVTNPREYGPQVKVTIETEQRAFIERLRRTLPAETFRRVLESYVSADSAGIPERDPSERPDTGDEPE